MVVVGVEMFNGTPSQAQSFKDQTGVTYPMLLLGGQQPGGNFFIDYGDRDNFVVVDPHGIVRYHAQNLWAYGNRYHRDEIRSVVDAWVGEAVDVEPMARGGAFTVSAAPNPARGALTFTLRNPESVSARGRIAVYDLAGRRVATAWEGTAAPGTSRIDWLARGEGGGALAAGLYLVRAELGARRLTRRIVLLE